MEESNKNKPDDSYGSVNDRPLFMANGNGATSGCNDFSEISNFRQGLPQFLAVSVKNTLLFVYGMTLGFPTVVIPAIQGGDGHEASDIVLNRDEISWFSSINLICVPLGCLFSGAFSHPIGKRRAMQIVNIPILCSWILFHFATKIDHLYAALCLSGLGGGLMEAPVLTYVAEITEPKYRGILSALGSTCVILGVFIQFIMGSFLDWRTIAAINGIFPIISIILLFFIPESPTWLIRQHKFKQAVKALQWLRGWVPEHIVEREFNVLYEVLITKPALEAAIDNAESEKPSKCDKKMKIFQKRTFWAPFTLVAFTFFVGHFSGKTTLQTYAVQIFHTLKVPLNKYHATILLGVAELIATVLCVILIHLTGKRPLVLISTFGVFLCLFGTATYAYFLNVVPGFAINNVVVNASSLIPQENIISLDNISRIFEIEDKASDNRLKELLDGNPTFRDDEYGFSTEISTIGYSGAVKQKRENSKRNGENETFFLSDHHTPYDINRTNSEFIDLPIFNISGYIEDVKNISRELPRFNTSHKNGTDIGRHDSDIIRLPSAKDVVEDILLPVPKQEKNNLAWIPLILLLGSAFFAHFGIRLIPWILIGEVFPASVRSTASGIVSAVGYIFGFLANKLFLQMLAALTMPGTFWFYSSVALMGAIILYFTLPETEGRTLAEIEEHFSKKSKNRLDKPWNSHHELQATIQATQSSGANRSQQNNLSCNRPNTEGQTNMAFENSNDTTHF